MAQSAAEACGCLPLWGLLTFLAHHLGHRPLKYSRLFCCEGHGQDSLLRLFESSGEEDSLLKGIGTKAESFSLELNFPRCVALRLLESSWREWTSITFFNHEYFYLKQRNLKHYYWSKYPAEQPKTSV